ncbi:hypothetical protein [Rahnella sp. ChDrAdgB13]|uniref:hypothetical protein n=1 Tax=Rahnella sp. ChDrAdgB13 TaxID=1850581 RepID=UPI001AD88698|nr:hypothetical protein [Rahnella sp. ChDrAdgB13]
MHILAHRGRWRTPEEKNTREALDRAFRAGFGVETDVRDLDGELVISHDMPGRGALTLETVLDDYRLAGRPGWLALNLKADGLAAPLKKLLRCYGVDRYFCFDMSVPDTLACLQAGLVSAARVSEYEPEGRLCTRAGAVWVDGFPPQAPEARLLQRWLGQGKIVCLVSPELHGCAADDFMTALRALPAGVREHPHLMVCTDHPRHTERKLKCA